MRSVRDIQLEALLNAATTAALRKAAASAAAVDGYDAVEQPTSLRLTRRTMAFYNALAEALGVSRNAVIQMVLDHLVTTVWEAPAINAPPSPDYFDNEMPF